MCMSSVLDLVFGRDLEPVVTVVVGRNGLGCRSEFDKL